MPILYIKKIKQYGVYSCYWVQKRLIDYLIQIDLQFVTWSDVVCATVCIHNIDIVDNKIWIET